MIEPALSTADLILYADGMSINKDVLRLSRQIAFLDNAYVYGLDLYSRTNYPHLYKLFDNLQAQERCHDRELKTLEKEHRALCKKLLSCRYAFFTPGESDVTFMIFKGAVHRPAPDEQTTQSGVDKEPFQVWRAFRFFQQGNATTLTDHHIWVEVTKCQSSAAPHQYLQQSFI